MRPKSRREFLTTAGAALAVARLGAQPGPSRSVFASVGRRARGASGGGITVFRINMNDGALTKVSETRAEADDLNCDGMCVSADGRLLYAVNQTPNVGGKAGAGGGSAESAVRTAPSGTVEAAGRTERHRAGQAVSSWREWLAAAELAGIDCENALRILPKYR